MANDDNWDITEPDREFLTRQGANQREAILAAGLVDGVPPWRIGEIAGYGAGKSNDPGKRRANWSAAVSRAAKRGGQVVTRIQALIDALKHFRQHGEGQKLAGEREVLEKLSTVIRGSGDASVISAARTLLESYRRDRVQKELSPEEVVRITVANVGLEKARIGIEALAPNLLCFLADVDPVESDSRLISELNGDNVDADLDARLERLEQRL